MYYEKKYDSDKKKKRSIKEIITGTPSKKHQNEEEEGDDGSSSINLRESYKKIQSEKKLKEYEKENMKRSKEEAESKRSLHERFVKWRERKQKLEEKSSNPCLSLYNYCIVPHKQIYDYFLGLFLVMVWLVEKEMMINNSTIFCWLFDFRIICLDIDPIIAILLFI